MLHLHSVVIGETTVFRLFVGVLANEQRCHDKKSTECDGSIDQSLFFGVELHFYY